MDQFLLPEYLEVMIPPGRVVWIAGVAIDRMACKVFNAYYPGRGSASDQPKMMTKVLVHPASLLLSAITKVCREQIPFLSAGQTPDLRTLNRFRDERMKQLIDRVHHHAHPVRG